MTMIINKIDTPTLLNALHKNLNEGFGVWVDVIDEEHQQDEAWRTKWQEIEGYPVLGSNGILKVNFTNGQTAFIKVTIEGEAV